MINGYWVELLMIRCHVGLVLGRSWDGLLKNGYLDELI
jgi:hypothetical protein